MAARRGVRSRVRVSGGGWLAQVVVDDQVVWSDGFYQAPRLAWQVARWATGQIREHLTRHPACKPVRWSGAEQAGCVWPGRCSEPEVAFGW